MILALVKVNQDHEEYWIEVQMGVLPCAFLSSKHILNVQKCQHLLFSTILFYYLILVFVLQYHGAVWLVFKNAEGDKEKTNKIQRKRTTDSYPLPCEFQPTGQTWPTIYFYKYMWNTATYIYLHNINSFIYTTTAQSDCDGNYMSHKA